MSENTMTSGFLGIMRSAGRNRTAMMLLVAQLAIAGGALIVNILSARALGPSARGELALFLQIAYAANLLCLLGRQRALLRLPPRDHSLATSYNDAWRLSGIPYLLTFVLAIVVGLMFEQWHLSAIMLILALFAKLSSGVLVNMHRAAAIAAQSAKSFLIATLGSQSLLVCGSVVFVLIPLDRPEPWLLLYGMTAAVPYLAVEFMVMRRHPWVRRDRAELVPIVRLGYQLLPGGFAEALLARADRFLLPLLANYAQLGVYAVVLTMTELITWPANQYSQARIPAWRVAYDDLELRWARALGKVMVLSCTIAIPFSIAIYMLIVPVFGSEYAGARALVLPLSLGALFQCVIAFGVNLSVAVGSPLSVLLISGAGTFVAVPLLIALVPTYGALGAAWAMSTGYAFAASVTLLRLWRAGQTMRKKQASMVEGIR